MPARHGNGLRMDRFRRRPRQNYMRRLRRRDKVGTRMKIIFNSLLVLIAAAIGLAIGFAWRNSRPISQPEALPVMPMRSEPQALARISTKPALPHNADSP